MNGLFSFSFPKNKNAGISRAPNQFTNLMNWQIVCTIITIIMESLVDAFAIFISTECVTMWLQLLWLFVFLLKISQKVRKHCIWLFVLNCTTPNTILFCFELSHCLISSMGSGYFSPPLYSYIFEMFTHLWTLENKQNTDTAHLRVFPTKHDISYYLRLFPLGDVAEYGTI